MWMSSDYVIQAGCGTVFFFFQAEDGIRDYKVTGVQTCALPIYAVPEPARDLADLFRERAADLGKARLDRRAAHGRLDASQALVVPAGRRDRAASYPRQARADGRLGRARAGVSPRLVGGAGASQAAARLRPHPDRRMRGGARLARAVRVLPRAW